MKWVARLTGILFLGAFVYTFIYLGQAGKLVELVKKIHPAWLLLIACIECATHIALALIWWIVIREGQARVPFFDLVKMSTSKQFVDQTIPTGVSGTFAVNNFLMKRGVSRQHAMSSLAVQIVSKYISYLCAFLLAVGLLLLHHSLSTPLMYLTYIFTIATILVVSSSAYIWRRSIRGTVPSFLKKYKSIQTFISSVREVPQGYITQSRILIPAVLLQIAIFFLDSTTLWAVLHSLGMNVFFTSALTSHVMASAAGSISFIPGGLGAIEGGLVGMLKVFGLSLTTGLVVTLIFRGITFWLPMIPGWYVTHKESR